MGIGSCFRLSMKAGAASLAFAISTPPVQAALVISSAQSQNITCANGVCAPTAADAVLNVADLEALLNSGSVTVTTTGADVQANDIDVTTAFTWSNATNLSLDAYQSIAIEKSVSVNGSGGLSLATNDGGSGGSLSIRGKGNVVFQSLSSQLTINGVAFTLVNSISTLASDIATDPEGDYALANSYDAAGDGTYDGSPISGTFEGTFEGLGNSISNLSIKDARPDQPLGLFSTVIGTIENFGLLHVDIVGSKKGRNAVGALAGTSGGHLFNVHATGKIRVQGSNDVVGGLVGGAEYIDQSYADVTIDGAKGTSEYSGGLAGVLVDGAINQSFSMGSVSVGDSGAAGGLVGQFPKGAIESTIANSYSTGSVTGGSNASIGGFFGLVTKSRLASTQFESTYSSGAVLGGGGSLLGGFGGKSSTSAAYSNNYWDETTSGTTQALGKGNADGGIQGETTSELQSGLPAGFDPAIWGLNRKINNGLPYLLNNPPPK